MIRKLHAVAAAVLALSAVSGVQALTIVGNSPTTLATEILGLPAGVTAVTVALNPIGFNSTSQGVVFGNNYSIKLVLSAGTWVAPAAGDPVVLQHQDPSQAGNNAQDFTVVSGGGTNTLTLAPKGVAVAATNTPVAYVAGGAATPAGLSSTAANTLIRFSGLKINAKPSDLIATGINDDGCGLTASTISLAGQYLDNNGNQVDLPVGTGNAGPILTAGQAITGVIAAPVTTALIDSRSSQSKLFVVGTGVPVNSAAAGTFAFSNASGTQSDNGATPADLTLATAARTDGGLIVNLNASSGFDSAASFSLFALPPTPAGNTTNGGICAAGGTAANVIFTTAGGVAGLPVAATAIASTSALATGNNSATVTTAAGTTPTTGTQVLVCYTVGGLTAIPVSKITGYAIAKNSAAATPTNVPLSDFAAGASCLANLASYSLNTGVIKVRNYSPASVNKFGWNQFTRIINSSATLGTPITGQYQYADGTVGTTAVLVANIAAGGNATLTNTQIEAALGAPDAAKSALSNPRLVIFSNNDSIRVQNYQLTPDTQRWMEVSGGQSDTATDATAQ